MKETRNYGGKPGFTLVELLIVIGIIGVLVSILLPVVNKARRQARRAQDVSNLHQLAAVCIAYTCDNHGYWPIGDTNGWPTDPAGAGDNVAFVNSVTFAEFFKYVCDPTASANWLANASLITNEQRRRLSCTSWWESEEVMLNYTGSTPIGSNCSYMGYIYWGGRDCGWRVCHDPNYVETSPRTLYSFAAKIGQKATSPTLLTCFAYSSPAYAADLPHALPSDYAVQTPYHANSPADSRFTTLWQGMNVAYMDGSAEFVPRTELWTMSDGEVWFYYSPIEK